MNDYEAADARIIDDSLVYMSLASRRGVALPACFGEAIVTPDTLRDAGTITRDRLRLPRLVGRKELPDDWSTTLLLGGGPYTESVYCLVNAVRTAPWVLTQKKIKGHTPYNVADEVTMTDVSINEIGEYRMDYRRYWLDHDTGVYINTSGTAFKARVGSSRLLYNDKYEKRIGAFDLMGATWMLPRVWKVRITLGPSPAVIWTTYATGVKELFKLRDKPEGRSRRAALLHWVTQHWRKDRHDPEAEVSVRKHLRGAEEFKWFDLTCRVVPSDLDLAASDKARQEKKDSGPVRRTNPALRKLLGGGGVGA